MILSKCCEKPRRPARARDHRERHSHNGTRTAVPGEKVEIWIRKNDIYSTFLVLKVPFG